MSPFNILRIVYATLGVLCLIAAQVLLWRAKRKNARCTAVVRGTVDDVSAINYDRHHVPLCVYEVDGVTYEIAGPLFEDVRTTPETRSNLRTRDALPARLEAPAIDPELSEYDTSSNTERYMYSALRTLYPLGSEVDIHYDPADPTCAYVQRPVREGWQFVFMLRIVAGVCLLYNLFYLVFYFVFQVR